MLNRNLKTIMLGFLFSSQTSNQERISFPDINTYTTDGTTYLCPDTTYTDRRQYISATIVNALSKPSITNVIASQNTDRLYMAVGTGTTEATEADYSLENENTDIICETIGESYTENYKRQITATFSNPTNANITITEVGLFVEWWWNEENLSNWLLARENINVTIPAGESKAITMEIG